MTAIEIVLIVIGVIMMIASFFVMEKLSNNEINKMAELSTEEIQRILERNMKEAEQKINDVIDGVIEQSIEESTEKVECALDKETNEKIKAINEYSDTVLESINKTHNEVMFLYSMLNDKHSELTAYAGKMAQLAIHLEELQESIEQTIEKTQEFLEQPIRPQEKSEETAKIIEELEEKTEQQEQERNQKQQILNMHKEGMDAVEIARQFNMGVGEVKLIIELFSCLLYTSDAADE